ncbi:DNA uptake protein [Vandammella animalimorsus]|uniref:DNA uptake protein n=1 Tax=Vandammella animalimorsus TaxID=2029117 RepID=A0A2A2T3D3_9BURK|nr:helix-hairpin-helix domain-containing protein [Vandammella animalimorsus]PAX15995.1 DNA uptake protein [Vandammella animalimorsus]PAX18130.1 DNA uptake protein [Vandammella animalimorsus]
MFKKLSILAAIWFWLVSAATAAVDVNKADAQELTQIKGIGAATAERIIEERAKGQFKDWDDFIARVKGVGAAKAQSLSEGGLTIGGAGYAPAAAPKPKGKAASEPQASTAPAAKPAAATAAPSSPNQNKK